MNAHTRLVLALVALAAAGVAVAVVIEAVRRTISAG
jgi:hypothetical protein